jgi:hypothetical protein
MVTKKEKRFVTTADRDAQRARLVDAPEDPRNQAKARRSSISGAMQKAKVAKGHLKAR